MYATPAHTCAYARAVILIAMWWLLGGRQIYTDEQHPQNHYILSPICGHLKVVMNRNKRPDMAIPKLTLTFYFDQIALSLDADQYRDMLDTLEFFDTYKHYQKYNRFRPTERSPEALWRFASTYPERGR